MFGGKKFADIGYIRDMMLEVRQSVLKKLAFYIYNICASASRCPRPAYSLAHTAAQHWATAYAVNPLTIEKSHCRCRCLQHWTRRSGGSGEMPAPAALAPCMHAQSVTVPRWGARPHARRPANTCGAVVVLPRAQVPPLRLSAGERHGALPVARPQRGRRDLDRCVRPSRDEASGITCSRPRRCHSHLVAMWPGP